MRMDVDHEVLPTCQPPVLAFAVLARSCGPTSFSSTLFKGAGGKGSLLKKDNKERKKIRAYWKTTLSATFGGHCNLIE